MNKPCYICSHTKFRPIYNRPPYTVYQCQHCGHATLTGYPPKEKLKTIYQKTYFSAKQSPEFVKDAYRKFSHIKPYLKKGTKVLDYGCGTGIFLSYLQRADYKPYGYDISAYAANQVTKRLNIEASSKPLTQSLYKVNTFDSICAFDVIEHIPDFQTVFDYFFTWLKPGGKLFLTIPAIDSWDAKLFGKHWYGFTKMPEHIHYFSKQSIETALKRSGFSLETKRQWGFIRSLAFIADHRITSNQPLLQFFKTWIQKSSLGKITAFFPMEDMLVIAKKP